MLHLSAQRSLCAQRSVEGGKPADHRESSELLQRAMCAQHTRTTQFTILGRLYFPATTRIILSDKLKFKIPELNHWFFKTAVPVSQNLSHLIALYAERSFVLWKRLEVRHVSIA